MRRISIRYCLRTLLLLVLMFAAGLAVGIRACQAMLDTRQVELEQTRAELAAASADAKLARALRFAQASEEENRQLAEK